LAAEGRKRSKRAQERLLAHVSRVLFATDCAVRKRIDGTLPSEHELVETFGVAANRLRNELLVGPRHAERGRVLFPQSLDAPGQPPAGFKPLTISQMNPGV